MQEAPGPGPLPGLQGIDHLVRNIQHGRFERSMAGLTAVGALITGAEIWMEHDRASFGNRMMWLPVAADTAGRVAGRPVCSRDGRPKRCCRSCRQWCWPTACRVSTFTCAGLPSAPVAGRWPATTPRWDHRRFAPLLFGMIGGMGLLASVLRRED